MRPAQTIFNDRDKKYKARPETYSAEKVDRMGINRIRKPAVRLTVPSAKGQAPTPIWWARQRVRAVKVPSAPA